MIDLILTLIGIILMIIFYGYLLIAWIHLLSALYGTTSNSYDPKRLAERHEQQQSRDFKRISRDA